MTAYLLDTSVFAAMEDDRPLAPLPVGEAYVSVVTLGELATGLALHGPDKLPHRIETLAEIEHTWTALPIDVGVIRRYASLAAAAKRAGRKAHMADALIAATASFHGMTVVTQDKDFLAFEGVDVVVV